MVFRFGDADCDDRQRDNFFDRSVMKSRLTFVNMKLLPRC